MNRKRIGESVYWALAVAVLVVGLFRIDINDDLGFVPFYLWCGAMALISFPIGIIAVPLSLCISFGIVYAMTAVFGHPFDNTALAGVWSWLFIVMAWLLMSAAGYLQWFRLVPKLRGKGEQSGT